MTSRIRSVRLPAVLLASALLLASPACAASAGQQARPTPTSEPGGSAHGIDAGAAVEVSSPARALVVADRDGELTLIDLKTEERTTLLDGEGTAGSRSEHEAPALVGTERFLHLVRADAGSVEVVDSGRWTVPHGDHSHSFRGEPRTLGAVDGDGVAVVRVGDDRSAVLFPGGDELTLLEHDSLAEGDLAGEPLALDPAAGITEVVPFAGHLLASTAGAVELLDESGALLPGRGAACSAPQSAGLTRVGAVFACEEGAVLFTREVGGEITVESIPYPAQAQPPAATTPLSGRTDRPDLAGAAAGGAWLLDVRERTWTFIPADRELLRAVALGDEDSWVVAVDADGVVRVLTPDGAEIARTEPLLAASISDPRLRERIQLQVDAHHAYITDPAAGAVHEIDLREGAVLARTFSGVDPWSFQQVG